MKWLSILCLWVLLNACTTTNQNTTTPVVGGSAGLAQEAIAALQAQDYSTARALAERSISLDPNNARAYSILGLTYQRLRNLSKAQENFSRAVQLDPGNVAIRNNYGSYLCANREYIEAEKNFLSAANNPNNPDPDIALANAGLCALRADDKAKAGTFFSNALRKNGAQTIALYQLSKLALENQDAITASGFLEHYLTHREHNAKSLLLAAEIERTLNNPTSQASLLEQLQRDFPDSPEARNATLGPLYTPPPPQSDAERTQEIWGSDTTPVGSNDNDPTFQLPDAQTYPEVDSIAVSEPIATAEDLPLAETLPVIEPTTEPAPAATTNKRLDQSFDTEWILSRDPLRYTIQLYTASKPNSLELIKNVVETDGIDSPISFGFVHNGNNKYTLISGDYETASEARAALVALSNTVKQYQPWIRRFDSIQRVISNKGIQ